jgi:tRNA uridine 5-carboxymethylaminomethyl modification enzyme
MFTSRAEFRTLLRQDNADFRLTPKGYAIGLASQKRLVAMQEKYEKTESLVEFFKDTSYDFNEINRVFESKNSALVTQNDKLFKAFSRPGIDMDDMRQLNSVEQFIQEHQLSEEVLEQAEILVKYSGYIEKERNNAEKLHRLEGVKIPKNFDYSLLKSLSAEARNKLTAIRPETIAQASRISGVSPNDISVLLIYMGR